MKCILNNPLDLLTGGVSIWEIGSVNTCQSTRGVLSLLLPTSTLLGKYLDLVRLDKACELKAEFADSLSYFFSFKASGGSGRTLWIH